MLRTNFEHRPSALIATTFRAFWGWGTVLLLGCELPTNVAFPAENLKQYQPPRYYGLWWEMVETCAGVRGNFDAVSWYRPIEGAQLQFRGESSFAGYWWEDGNRIAVKTVGSGPLVRHEMLHALLRSGRHPASIFAGSCAGIVSFNVPETYGATAAELDSSEVRDASDVLNVSVSTFPSTPQLGRYDGHFVYVVTATNTSGRPIWVHLNGGIEASVFVLEDQVGGGLETSQQRRFFKTGQSISVYLDGYAQSAGTIHVVASYGAARSEIVPVTLLP